MEFTASTIENHLDVVRIKSNHNQIMHLSIFVDSEDEELKKLYIESANKHNAKLVKDLDFYDAGFDLYLPKNSHDEHSCGTKFFKKNSNAHVNKVDFNIKCCAKMFLIDQKRFIYASQFTPFYTYARSSLSKTPLRLANNQGIIDAGYRGSLIGMFDCIHTNTSDDSIYDYYLDEYTRILQICAPGLVPIYVEIVDTFECLGPSTLRGSGGFGSTGK